MVKLTKQQLKKIIRETIEESLPRMSGMMNPEDPEVMDRINREKTWSDEKRWMENNREFIDFAKDLIDEEGHEREMVEDILLSGLNPPSQDDVGKIYDKAIEELGPEGL